MTDQMDDGYYVAFENTFRGARKEIISRLAVYDGLLNELSNQFNGGLVVDIGCGRGEWLEKCAHYGFQLNGVDLDSGMAEECSKRGLAVEVMDGITYLKGLANHSCAMVSAFHIIEHVDHNYLQKLAKEALRVLVPSGILLMETPSCDNLIVGTKSFYSDPTHLRPIHPETTCFDLKYLGYAWAEPFYINGNRSYQETNKPSVASILLSPARDVALIALTPGGSGHLSPDDPWSETLRNDETMTMAAERVDQELREEFRKLEELFRLQTDKLNQEINALKDIYIELDAVYKSQSWKLTQPLRQISQSIKTTVQSLRNGKRGKSETTKD